MAKLSVTRPGMKARVVAAQKAMADLLALANDTEDATMTEIVADIGETQTLLTDIAGDIDALVES